MVGSRWLGVVTLLLVAPAGLAACSKGDFATGTPASTDTGAFDASVPTDTAEPLDEGVPDASLLDFGQPDTNAPDTFDAKETSLPETPPPLPCVGKADGTVCPPTVGPRRICLKESCEVSRCGDKFVDLGEDCDDGNDKGDDGCEPTCKFSCTKTSDCDDKDPCNGSETCEAHTCKPGTKATDGTACLTPESVLGVCKGGVCAKPGCGNGVTETGEECDDGNATDDDGCGNDCKWNCKADGDCDDANVCNGKETCVDHKCVAGSPLVCNDGDACTDDYCDATAGCKSSLIDNDGDGYASTTLGACGKDCDDGNANVYPGAAEICDGKDNNCNGAVDEGVKVTCYPDADGDGYGANTGAISACSCGPGYSALAGDCHDGNAEVKPGQGKWFTEPYTASDSGKTSFDYNCSGSNETQVATNTGSCTLEGIGNCRLVRGWLSGAPACGDKGDYVTSCSYVVATGCKKVTSVAVMGCH